MSDTSQNSVTPDVTQLVASVKSFKSKGPAPVHLWNPPFCGDLDMRIGRDGTWYYLGSPIGRKPLVKLFASILRKDGEKYFLVTPVEKVGITVEDAPFVAVDFQTSGSDRNQSITFTTNVEDSCTAGPEHPIRLVRDPETGEPSPYIRVRSNLEALIDRKSFYRLVELGVPADHNGEGWFGVWSNQVFFPFIRLVDLEGYLPTNFGVDCR